MDVNSRSIGNEDKLKMLMEKMYPKSTKDRIIDLFGKWYCGSCEKSKELIGNKIESKCNHPVYQNFNAEHNEIIIYFKNILMWLDLKKNSANDLSNHIKTSLIHVDGQVSELKLQYTLPNPFNQGSTTSVAADQHHSWGNCSKADKTPDNNKNEENISSNSYVNLVNDGSIFQLKKLTSNNVLAIEENVANTVQINEDTMFGENNILNLETSSTEIKNSFTKKRTKSSSRRIAKIKKLMIPTASNSTQSDSGSDTVNTNHIDHIDSDMSGVTSELEKSAIQDSLKKNNPDHTNDSKKKVLTNTNSRNSKGETRLYSHCAKGELSDVISLLNVGFCPNVKDNAGWTPLHEAVKYGHKQIVEILIEFGALINVPGFEYETPLFTAIRYGHFDIGKLLLEKGANSKCINIYGTNAQSLNVEMWSKLSEFEMPYTSSKIENIPYKWDTICIFLNNGSLNSDIINRFCVQFKAKSVPKNLFKKQLKQITHIVVPANQNNTCEINYQILMGIANGICILNENWLVDSLEDDKKMLKLMDDYEVKGTTSYVNSDGPRMSRLCKQNLVPKLLDGIDIHISGSSGWENLSVEQLKEIVFEFGAKVLNRMPNPEDCPTNIIPYHCRDNEQMCHVSTIVLYTNNSNRLIKYNMSHLKVFPISWFMEAAQKYRIV